jgi:predicted small secreted protein
MFKLTMIFVLTLCSLTIMGCHTMKGLGEDIEAGGSKLAKAATPAPKPTPVVVVTK